MVAKSAKIITKKEKKININSTATNGQKRIVKWLRLCFNMDIDACIWITVDFVVAW